jgi:hypothetical protein
MVAGREIPIGETYKQNLEKILSRKGKNGMREE